MIIEQADFDLLTDLNLIDNGCASDDEGADSCTLLVDPTVGNTFIYLS